MEKKGKSLKNKGKNNGNWKGGLNRKYSASIYRKLSKKLKQYCVNCRSTEKLVVHQKLVVHHIDENYLNNALENLVIVCRSCHAIIHNKGKKRLKK